MKRIVSIIVAFCCAGIMLMAQQSFPRDKYVVAGFYPYMKEYVLKPESINIDNLTHVVYAFAFPRADGSIGTESGSYHTLAAPLVQRLHAAGKKFVCLMGGGIQSGGYHDMAASSATRTAFINNLVGWMETYGYDGINIDWEYPGANDKNEDRDNLTALVQEMRQAFDAAGARLGRYIEISIDVHSSLYYAQWVDFAALKNYIDWFGLMSYDYAGNWSYCIHAAHNAPLYCGPAEICDRYLCVERGVQNLRDTLGIPAEQIVMGVPFYGAEFYNSALYETPREGGGAVPYYDIEPLIGNGWERHWDNQSMVPYLLKTSGSGVITYDDVESIGIKRQYIQDNAFLGAMIWEITQDVNKTTKQQPLLNEIGKMAGMDRDISGKPSVSITSPADKFVFTPGQSLTISANASVETGFAISRVEFYLNNALLATDNSAPYQYTINSMPAGKHTLKAIAYSSNGKYSESGIVSVTDGLVPDAVEMFDDFNYSGYSDPQLQAINNWYIVDGVSGPPSGAVYAKENITFFADPDLSNNMLMGVVTTANNNPENNRHARIETADMVYQRGTFAARVFFDDTPALYNDGNVETFYTINSYATCNNPDLYSEVDFEYLPWDSWHWERKNTMYMTTWETCEIRTHEKSVTSYQGWHDLVYAYVPGGPVKFYIDGNLLASINADVPDSDQNISFANWIYQNTVGSSPDTRTTTMKVDWVYHAKDIELAPADVLAKVNNFRSNGIIAKNIQGNVRYGGTIPQVPPTVSISAPSNGAVYQQGSVIAIAANAGDTDGSVTSVEFFVNGNSIGTDNAAPYTANYTATQTGNYTISARATDNDNLSTNSAVVTISVEPVNAQSPYPAGPHPVPGVIEAENYDIGGEGIAWHDVTAGNSGGAYRQDNVDIEPCSLGGYNVGWIADGEWLEYTVNVQTTGSYNIAIEVASTTFTGNLTISFNGNNVTGTVVIAPTGGWQTWTTVQVNNVQLTAGTQIMRISFPVGSFNLNRATFTLAGNNAPPQCTITQPANNAQFTIGSNVAIAANASDTDGTVTQVSFYVNGVLLSSDNTAPYTANYTAVAGTRVITAVATDNSNLSTTSLPVTITVGAAPVYPVVNINSPANNSSFVAGNNIQITANASDADGSIAKVDFYHNGSLLSTDNTSPYSASITGAAVGAHTIYAVATDNSGLTTTSSTVNISVVNDTPASLEVIYQTIVAWGSGFQGQVTIINHSNFPAANWVVEFDCGNNIAPVWDAQIVQHTGNHYVFSGPAIAANATHIFGFIGNVMPGQTLSTPVNVSVGNNKSAIGYESTGPISSMNYPNPFADETNIIYELPQSGKVQLMVYNLHGQLIETLVNSYQEKGRHSVSWTPQNTSAGVYFYKIVAENASTFNGTMVISYK
ncbi:MAG: carbohydrate-binding protein [Bacteroidales bacterium]|nr:carbohydrate-binding protein [Bacteroidales bacterium]